MNKRWFSVIAFFIVLMTVSTILFTTQLKIENEYARAEEKVVVLSNKVWKITFTDKLKPSTINHENVYVVNNKGEKLNGKVELSEDQKTVIVHPPEKGYDLSSQSFTLHIEKGIQSIYGRGITTSKEINFIVKESLPVIGSKSNLDHYFLNIIKQQKKETRLFDGMNMAGGEKKEAAPESASSADHSSQDVSETNVQVQGIDESDIVKTNGTHIFQVVDGKVNIVKVNNKGEMKLETVIDYTQTFFPSQLFLHGEKLLVIGYSYEEEKPKEKRIASEPLMLPMYEKTKAIVYDIKDTKDPVIVKELALEGHFVTARKIDELVYFVTNYYPHFWMLEDNENVDLRPRYSDSSKSESTQIIDYDKIQYFPDSKETNYTNIAVIDLNQSDKEANISSYLGSGNQVYMSKESLYLAISNWANMPMRSDEYFSPDTNVYKFSVDGMNVTFDSSIEVQGTVLNQFSMDEHNGFFRIATTKGFAWDDAKPSSNNLYIFDENLKNIGKLEDLARGERIYSARFMGDRIYIVTFKETDPLFVIDASIPNQPKVLGELKIPGFSNYLHPYDEHHLIGFGHDTKLVTEKGEQSPRVWTDGVKISLFDITDVTKPKEKFTEIIGGRGTYSSLNYDHKALLYNKNKNLFAFPINVYQNVEGSLYEQKFEFQGAYVYNIHLTNGFELRSKITHQQGKEPYEEWGNEIQRLVYIGETLFALSPSKITSHHMSDFTEIQELQLMK